MNMGEVINSMLPGALGEPPELVVAERRRRRMLARLWVLAGIGVLGFTLMTWLLVRVEDPAALLGYTAGPSSVVRTHLDALNRGDVRAAYECFSADYRGKLRFETYHQMVATHREMFLTRRVEFGEQRLDGERVSLDARLVAADGAHYRARFVMVRLDGRWWIDGVRWRAEPPSPLRSV